MSKVRYGVKDVPPLKELIPFSIQQIFAMFGSTILVPLLVGLSVNTALFTAGLGTIIFCICTKFKVPIFLGSSFAFIPVLIASASSGIPIMCGGVIASGLFYVLISFVISKTGTKWLDKVFPSVVIGSVIVCIGLTLAPTAVDMAMNLNGEYSLVALSIAIITLAATLFASNYLKGFVSSIPVLIGLIVGYLFTLIMGKIVPAYNIIDFSSVKESSWIGLPKFIVPQFNFNVVLAFVIVSFSTMIEHIGDIYTVSKVCNERFYEDPGLNRTLLGDGLGTLCAGLFGGPNNTSYGENIGTLQLSGVHSIWVIFGAAIGAIILSLFPKFGALISTIPSACLGGISMLLFGSIASSGLRNIVDAGVDYSNKKNLAIASVVMVIGIGGLVLQFKLGANQVFGIKGVALASVVGILLNLILPKDE